MKRIFLLFFLPGTLIALISYFTITNFYVNAEQGPLHTLELLDSEKYSALNEIIYSQQRIHESGINNEKDIFQTLNVFHSSNEGLEKKLDKWVENTPDAYPAYLARGSYYINIASLHRGTKFSNDTDKQQLSKMRNYHRLAKDDLNKALKLNNKLMYAYGMLIRIATSSGSRSEIEQLSKEALGIDPSSYIIHRQIMFKLQPKWGGSMASINGWLEQIIKPQLKNNPLLKTLFGYPDYILAEQLRKKKKFKDSEYYFNKSIEASDSDYNVLFLENRGENYYYREAYDKALIDLNKAISQYPYYTSALETRGKTLTAMGRYDDALHDLDLAIRLDQYDPDLRRARSYLYRIMKMYKQALEDANASLKFGSYDNNNWRNQGYILLYGIKDYAGAETAYKKAIELYPADETSWYELGIAQYNQLSCDFMSPIKVYLEMCKTKECAKELVDWSTSSLETAINEGYCKKPATATPG